MRQECALLILSLVVIEYYLKDSAKDWFVSECVYVTRRSFCIVKNCQYHKLAFRPFRRALLCFWTFCASLLVCFCYCFLTDSFITTRKLLFWYKLKVVHLSSSGNWEKYFSLYKKKKRNNTTATLCWMHLSTMFLMHNMTSVSLVCHE